MISVPSMRIIHIKHRHESKRLATRERGYSERAPGVEKNPGSPVSQAACCPITNALVS